MDPFKAFDSGILRYLVTFFIPGIVATGPYLYWIKLERNISNDDIIRFGPMSILFLTILSIIVGFIIENLGSRFEKHIMDRMRNDRKIFDSNWDKYLLLKPDDKIMHSYIGYILTRMKFELNLTIALLISLWGMVEVNSIKKYFTGCATFFVSVVLFLVIAYLIFETFSSHSLLADKRQQLLDTERDS